MTDFFVASTAELWGFLFFLFRLTWMRSHFYRFLCCHRAFVGKVYWIDSLNGRRGKFCAWSAHFIWRTYTDTISALAFIVFLLSPYIIFMDLRSPVPPALGRNVQYLTKFLDKVAESLTPLHRKLSQNRKNVLLVVLKRLCNFVLSASNVKRGFRPVCTFDSTIVFLAHLSFLS